MCKPGLATLTIFTFNFMWNDYLPSMIYLDDDKLKTVQVGLTALRTLYKTEYGLLMAGTVCALILGGIYIFLSDLFTGFM